MCGIVGVYYFDREMSVSEGELNAMNDAIFHRGPDDAGIHVAGNVGFGMRRLSIIDLAGGHQPIVSEKTGNVIVYNGEMYNHAEQRQRLEGLGHNFSTRSDTEVILRLWDEHGEEGVEYVNGMFAIVLFNPKDRSLTLVRDRLGIKPVYYYQDDKKVIFASEIKAILAHPEVRTRIDRQGLAGYLRYGFTPPDRTLFAGIRKLPSAHSMRINVDGVNTREYWRLSYQDKLPANSAQVREELYELLVSAVKYQMVSDVPLGAFLSGGFDSSGIVHMMSDLASGPVNTYSIGFGAGFENYNELGPAQSFAKVYETNHHEIQVDPDVRDLMPRLIGSLDEPLADSSFLVTYMVAELARKSVTVILSGVGGDELFGGYRRYLSASLGRYANAIPGVLRRNVILPILNKMPVDRNSRVLNLARLARAYLSTADLPAEQQYGAYTALASDELTDDLIGSTPYDNLYSRYTQDCDSEFLLDKLMYYDLKTSLPEQLLMLTDKMTMATSLEARVPFLDHRVVEYAARIPVGDKLRGREMRWIQKETFRGKIPDFVYEQKKKGFGAPVGVWLRRDLKSMVEDLLSESHLKRQGVFNPTRVRTMIDDHQHMRADYTDQLLALVGFQLWSEHYGAHLS